MKLRSTVFLLALAPLMALGQDTSSTDNADKPKPIDPIVASEHQGSGRLGLKLDFDKATGIPHISALTRGGPAADFGLIIGDTIIRIGRNYTSTLTQDEIRMALHGAAGSGVELTIQRGDNPKYMILAVARRTLPEYSEEMVQPPLPEVP